MITLYGTSRSRASRSLLALVELGLDYRHVPTAPGTDSRHADFLKLNPNGKIPCLDDDGLIVWESLAINLYLADRYGAPPLWPADARARAPIYQWSFWAKTELGPKSRAVYRAQAAQDSAAERTARGALCDTLALLEHALDVRPYLLGETFSLADLNLAASLSEPQEGGHVYGWADFDLASLPRLAVWLARCTARPSYDAVSQLP
jgi:glutathione S-transferase